MNEHPQFEDFDLYVLGALDAQERAEMESHLKNCEACAGELAAAYQHLSLMALSVPVADPPKQIKDRLMHRIRQESPAAIPFRTPRKSSALWRGPIVAWALAACLAVAAGLSGIYNYQLQHRLRAYQDELSSLRISVARDRAISRLLTGPDTQRVVLTQAQDSSRPEGRIYYNPNRGLLFYATNLPAAPSNRVYQLWLVPSKGLPISAGIFAPNSRGEASVILPELPSGVTAKAFAVTLEPAGGVPQPTGPKVLIGLPA